MTKIGLEQAAAIQTGPDLHILDHIAPLADLLGIPLYITEEENERLARLYYPQVKLKFFPDPEFRFGELAGEFDVLFDCKYWGPHIKQLFKDLYKKEMRLVFCPHGQSEKGYKAPILVPYAYQDIVLLNGELMAEMLRDLKINLPTHAYIGNYRYLFYQKYKSFYDELADREVFSSLPADRPTLLYAPTWKDLDQSSSFFSFGSKVIEELPSSWNLIVKLHPLIEQRHPAEFASLVLQEKENVRILTSFPPVHPILSRCDAYLGDFSSIGYDFLLYQKPLYFLPTQEKTRLHSCGTILQSHFYQEIENRILYTEKQKALYQHAFKDLNEEQIRHNIEHALER